MYVFRIFKFFLKTFLRDTKAIRSLATDRKKSISEAWSWAQSSGSAYWFSSRKSFTYSIRPQTFSELIPSAAAVILDTEGVSEIDLSPIH